MYQVSKEFEESILSGSRTFLVKIEVDGTEVDRRDGSLKCANHHAEGYADHGKYRICIISRP